MNNSAKGNGVVSTGGAGKVRYLKKDFWSEENLRYSKPHFRMEKAARIINQSRRASPGPCSTWAAGRPCCSTC